MKIRGYVQQWEAAVSSLVDSILLLDAADALEYAETLDAAAAAFTNGAQLIRATVPPAELALAEHRAMEHEQDAPDKAAYEVDDRVMGLLMRFRSMAHQVISLDSSRAPVVAERLRAIAAEVEGGL